MSIDNSQRYITNELVPHRMKETARKKLRLSSTSKKVKHNKGNSQRHSLDGSHVQNFIYVMCKIHYFYYQEMVRARNSTPYFLSKCHLHHRGEKLFAFFFFYSTSTISLLWNICISVLGHNIESMYPQPKAVVLIK